MSNEETEERIKLKNVRLSYPVLFEPKTFRNSGQGKKKYGCSLILNKKKDAEQIAMLRKKIEEARVAAKLGTKLKQCCLHDGSESDKDGYGPDVVFLRCTSNEEYKPALVDRNPKRALLPADDKIFAGAIVNATVSLWAFNSPQWGQQVNCNILIVQFVEDDGTRYGGEHVDPETECENLEDEDADPNQ